MRVANLVRLLILADCKWRAAAPVLRALRLPRARLSRSAIFCEQVLACKESATSEYSTTSQCLGALLGRLWRVKFVLHVLGWKKINQPTYHCHVIKQPRPRHVQVLLRPSAAASKCGCVQDSKNKNLDCTKKSLWVKVTGFAR